MKLDRVPSTEVTVCVNGEGLQEYDDISDKRLKDSIGVKYIEAKSDSNFSVRIFVHKCHLVNENEEDVLLCYLYLDGRPAVGAAFQRKASLHHKSVMNIEGVCNHNLNTFKRFKFANLQTNDESSAGIQIEKFKCLGEIELKMLWGRVIPNERRRLDQKFEPVVSGEIPEKCLKGRAVSRMATLDESEPDPYPSEQEVEVDLNHSQKHFATFFFKYRSRKDLQIEGIIPRDPSPIPLEDRDIDDLSREEALQRLRHQESGAQRPEVKIKKEKRDLASVTEDDNDENNDVTITAEYHRHKRQRIPDDSGVIDISDDDENNE